MVQQHHLSHSVTCDDQHAYHDVVLPQLLDGKAGCSKSDKLGHTSSQACGKETEPNKLRASLLQIRLRGKKIDGGKMALLGRRKMF